MTSNRFSGGRRLIRHAGPTRREAAEQLSVGTGAAVSRQQKMLTARFPSDRRLRTQLDRIESDLAQVKR